MIHIVGTNHELQHSARPKRAAEGLVKKAREELQEYLRLEIKRLKPVVVAEESVEEVLKCLGAESTVKAIADECGIKHLYCDPDSVTRNRLGVPIGSEHLTEEEKQKFHKIRENYWYQQIEPYNGQAILFVCGAEHVSSFRALLEQYKCRIETLCEYWGKNIYGT